MYVVSFEDEEVRVGLGVRSPLKGVYTVDYVLSCSGGQVLWGVLWLTLLVIEVACESLKGRVCRGVKGGVCEKVKFFYKFLP